MIEVTPMTVAVVPTTVAEALDRLAELRAQRDAQIAGIQSEMMAIQEQLAEAQPVLVSALDVLQAQIGCIGEELQAEMAALESYVKTQVLAGGATAKGAHLMAVYTKGRETVDMKAFSGYAIAHPDARALVRVGEPTVSIRPVGR